ncbi:Gfo/Idh/MocA family oxidoreductase [Coraliomargarita algicola]|uniref:Gfo/Idh/MocA family oxidoreductase n=1 Tax=Coraliomargarita algicola TaxID=3092156 RepID=A0ABZ0RI77_9BACT|nr:Gfo/Idh/MocA family oxidoreductase [Coraliomargarita sp. J2-16]WPJ95178.1 Gfo/Idh/MocA family oxidoreductase [Coraliomargarita sp. J2-16]
MMATIQPGTHNTADVTQQEQAPKPRTLAVALVGVSGYGNAHYKLIKRAAERGLFQLKAATIINQAEEAEKCSEIESMGGRIYDDFARMLTDFKDKIDLCFIPTGIHHHAEMTRLALNAGANVYVEKPAAATIQLVNSMLDAEANSDQFVAVGFQHVYDPAARWVKQSILDGAIGQIHSIKSRALWPRSKSYYSRNNWAGKLQLASECVLDSPFNNALAHPLNLMCFFAGEKLHKSAMPQTVQAELYRAYEIESPDTACIRIQTTNGIRMHFYASHSCPSKENPTIEITGASGTILWSMERAQLLRNGIIEAEIPCANFKDMLGIIGESMFKRYSDSSILTCTLEMAKAHTLCVNAAHESSSIHTIPTQYLETIPSPEGEEFISIQNIQSITHQAYQNELLFSELNIPWAKSTTAFQLSNYTSFHLPVEGCHQTHLPEQCDYNN